MTSTRGKAHKPAPPKAKPLPWGRLGPVQPKPAKPKPPKVAGTTRKIPGGTIFTPAHPKPAIQTYNVLHWPKDWVTNPWKIPAGPGPGNPLAVPVNSVDAKLSPFGSSPSPAPSVFLPAVGPGSKGSGGIMTPVTPHHPGQWNPAPTQTSPARVNIPHPTGPISPYANPFAASGGVTGQRIDQGVDYTGKAGAPIGALGPGKIVSAQASGSGWPGGGFIGEQLTAGPAKGQVVYTAEDVAPTVRLGQTVKAGQQVGKFTPGGSIETGWGTLPPNVGHALAYGKQSAPGSDPGAYSTGFGIAFNKLLTALGAPSGKLQSVISGTAPAKFSSTGGKVLGVKPTPSPRVTIPAVPTIPVVSGVNPPSSTPGGGIAAKPAVKRAAGSGSGLTGPTGPAVGITGTTITPTASGTTSSGGTVTNITVPPDFIFSSGQTGGLTYGTNVAQPVATGTTGKASGPGLGTLLLVGGGGVVAVVLLTKKGKK